MNLDIQIFEFDLKVKVLYKSPVPKLLYLWNILKFSINIAICTIKKDRNGYGSIVKRI